MKNRSLLSVLSGFPALIPVVLLLASGSAFATDVTYRQPASWIADLIQIAFRGRQSPVAIHINNFGTQHAVSGGIGYTDQSWFQPDGTFIRLSDTLGGNTLTFNISEAVKFNVKYYVNDVNLKETRVAVNGSALTMSFLFEDAGTELKGFFVTLAGAAAAPDVDLQNIRADVSFVPLAWKGSIAFGRPVTVAFHADMQMPGVPAHADIFELLTGYREKIRAGVEGGLRQILDDDGLRDRIAESIRPNLKLLNIRGAVSSARIEGPDLVIQTRLDPPQVTPATVKACANETVLVALRDAAGPIDGTVQIAGQSVGRTNQSFTHSFHLQKVVAGGRPEMAVPPVAVQVPGWGQVSSSLSFTAPKLAVSVTTVPSTVEPGHTARVTVTAAEAGTGRSVRAPVFLGFDRQLGVTGEEFSYQFTTRVGVAKGVLSRTGSIQEISPFANWWVLSDCHPATRVDSLEP